MAYDEIFSTFLVNSEIRKKIKKIKKKNKIIDFKKTWQARSGLSKKITIKKNSNAWKLDRGYYDGNRLNGYGGFKYDGRWLNLLPKLIKKYNLTKDSKFLDLGCKKGFIFSYWA